MSTSLRLMRIAAIALWVEVGLAALSVLLGDVERSTAMTAWIAFGTVIAGLATAIALGSGRFFSGGLREGLSWPTIVTLVGHVIWVTAVVALSGGLDGPLWPMFIPIVLFGSIVLDRVQNAALAILLAVLLLAAAQWSGSLDGGGSALDIVAVGCVIGCGLISDELASSLFRMEAESEDARRALERQVQELSAALDRAAHGDLAQVVGRGDRRRPGRGSDGVVQSHGGESAGVGGADSWGW